MRHCNTTAKSSFGPLQSLLWCIEQRCQTYSHWNSRGNKYWFKLVVFTPMHSFAWFCVKRMSASFLHNISLQQHYTVHPATTRHACTWFRSTVLKKGSSLRLSLRLHYVMFQVRNIAAWQKCTASRRFRHPPMHYNIASVHSTTCCLNFTTPEMWASELAKSSKTILSCIAAILSQPSYCDYTAT